ncbi:hypothetical protein [Flavobacterium sp.]|uniref:hypothetical protein n=1 Tax=Flavobacterium sp. TaxID=239 RepID=UPI001B768865|nr:hypothetical protein [Flavobacterium sp.]MBP6182965.1 hypothetical protein [Flavobacterium sp.]
MKRLYILTLCSIGLAACILFFKKRNPTTIATNQGLIIPKEWLVTNKNPITPKNDVRPADQTFLTFPEWYLVFSPEEQANYFKKHTATSFPFMSHSRQIWESYRIVNNQIKGNFPTNKGYHFMIWVIGTSATIEYAIKACYETIVGRITDTYTPKTDEDKFNSKFTDDYVIFIKDKPWYEFDFKSRLKKIWTENSFIGDNFFRKIERKYILTSELFVKWGYGKLIGLGTKQVYDLALPTTAVILDNDSLKNLPRYDKFTEAAIAIAKRGHIFKEIGGNNSAILLTVLVPANNEINFENTKTIFIQPISSDLKSKRIAFAIPVKCLSSLLIQLDTNKIKVEHIFDY